MPITETIKERHVAKTDINWQILEMWYESEEHLPDAQKENVTDKENIIKLKGSAASIKRWLEEHEIHITDAGQKIKLKGISAELDYRAYVLYENFRYFLNDVAIKIGLNSRMDSDLSNGKDMIEEYYALIKDILLRLALKILANKAEKNGNSEKYLKVWKAFIKKLSQNETVSLKHKNFILQAIDNFIPLQNEPSEFAVYFT